MQTWKTILLDDSEGINLVLKRFLEMDCPQIEIVGMASNIKEAEMMIIQEQPHILLLDIHVNDETSIDLLKYLFRLDKINFEVIFVTGGAQDDLLTKAIHFSYIDCISKPVDPRILKKNIEKITTCYSPGLPNERIGVLLNLIESQYEPQLIHIPFMTKELRWFHMEEVEYFKSDKSGTICSLINKKTPVFSAHNINIYKKWLVNRSSFISVNTSFLVNMRKVQRFNARKNILYMQSGEQIMVAMNCINHVIGELSSRRKSISTFPGFGLRSALRKLLLN